MTILKLDYAPKIEGLIFRTFAGEQDYAQIAAVENAGLAFDTIPFRTNTQEVGNEWTHTNNFDIANDAILVELDSKLVGYGRMSWHINDEGQQIFLPQANTSDEARRKGIGAAMMRWLMERAQAQATKHPHNGPREMRVWSADTQSGKSALLEKSGFVQFRYGFLMQRSLSEPIPNLPMPQGTQTRGMEEQDLPKLFWGLDEAFRDHFGHAPSTTQDLQKFLDDPFNKPVLYQVAWDTKTNEIAGAVMNHIFLEDNAKLGVKWGWTDPIFVRRPWRKLGLAKALIARSLHLFKAMGMDAACLGVDALNPNGALKLYESLGYVAFQKSFRWRKELN